MSKKGVASGGFLRSLVWLALLIALVYLLRRYLGVVSNVITVMLGFGAVVLVHEFGHFIVAKLGGIKVEAFSMFMPPTLVGLQRTEAGWRLRFLPAFFSPVESLQVERKEGRESDEGGKSLLFGRPGKAADTEYRIGLIPFGGYVKLLGQDDVGPVRQNDDPRSFANRPIRVRIPVIAAGVIFNAISAAVIFMVVFLVGIHLPPAVVGEVEMNSPAAQAGLKTGDEILEIAGQDDDIDFSNVMMAAALSGQDESVAMTVRRRDGSEEKIYIAADQPVGAPFKRFGIGEPVSLTVASLSESDAALLEDRLGLKPGDQVIAVDGEPVEHYWQFADRFQKTLAPSLPITVRRGTEQAQSLLPRDVAAARSEDGMSIILNHVYSMVPRMRIVDAQEHRTLDDAGASLQVGDILVAVDGIENPTFQELRETTEAHEDKSMSVTVLRPDANGVERSLTVAVTPRRAPQTLRVVIGIVVAMDLEHPVVAQTIAASDGPAQLDIPRGATIVAVNDQPVSSYYDIIKAVQRWEGQPVNLQYRRAGQVEGGVTVQTAQVARPFSLEPIISDTVPFKRLERLYRADGPIEALSMGYRRTVMFVAQTYLTLKRLLGGLLSPKLLMGPVGIMVSSYQIVAEQSTVYYAYFLGLLSASIAVLNLLPMPPFDGGLIVLMLIEKIRGSALSEKAQGILAYTGWVLVLALLLYVTFHDLLRTFGPFFN